ncbi:MAG TPA: hypothetical protein VGT78_00010 [Rhizomicrobium sp.]|nr:hypothetical protein [Rhizomicrobium sp.]
MRAILLAAAIVLLGASPCLAGASWRITKDHWSEADEQGFEHFVTAIGSTNCSSSESCLRNPANPYRSSDPRSFYDIDVDCAKLPYLLRAYYAWKNGLPFSYVDGLSGEGGDLRYTKTANRATSRHDIVDRGEGIDAPAAIIQMLDTVFSGTYRTDAREKHGVLSDFYSPALQPGTIRPGTIVYDVNGHVGMVWKVDDDGRAYYMDAHPDFTITRSVYGAQFGQSPVRLGGGFKNWRPFRLAGAHRDAVGHLLGGHMAYAENSDIADYSLVQYAGTEFNPDADVKVARYKYNGIDLGFYEYVRVAVSGGKMDYNPIYELKQTMRTLCNDLHDRAQYVDLAVSEGFPDKPHPTRLPDNIYGSSDNDWEQYSTPSRDARIKSAFVQFYKDMAEMIQLWQNRDPRIVYDGQLLKHDLQKAYDSESQACTITYLSSDKHPVPMTFDDMAQRLFLMSFDPYDCIELRWGDERSSCTDGPAKQRWYAAEQRLRNQPDRTYDAQMGFSIAELNARVKWSGIDQAPPVNIRALIDNMGDQISFQGMTPVGR